MLDKILHKLHLVRESEHRKAVDSLTAAYRTARDQSNHDSELAAALVDEAQNQGKIIDDLSDENARLRKQIEGEDKLRDEIADLNNLLRERGLKIEDYKSTVEDVRNTLRSLLLR